MATLDKEPAVRLRALNNMAATASEYIEAHSTVNQIIAALENMTDPLEIDGLVLRIDYLIRTLVNLGNHPRTDEIIHLLGEVCNELISTAQSMLVATNSIDSTSQIYTHRRGRPAFEIKEDQLSFLLDEGFKIPIIALILGVSTRTVERRMKKYGLSVSGKLFFVLFSHFMKTINQWLVI